MLPATPFHRYEFIETCTRHLDARLHPYVGYKGREPVGLFPVFEMRKGPFTAAFSPPPNLKVHYLGPTALNDGKPKTRKREQRNRAFVEAVLDTIDRDIGPRYVNVRTTPSYEDERPFHWVGDDATPRYRYVLDLTADEEALLANCSKSLRKTVREGADGLEISRATPPEIEWIVEEVIALHERKDADYHLTPAFVSDLYEELPDGVVHAHVCRYEGELCGGEVSLEHDGTAYGWQSAAAVTLPVPVYDLLYWTVFQEAKARGCTAYDLLGANNPDLCTYKAKFSPELRKHQALNRGSWDMKAAAKLYKRLR